MWYPLKRLSEQTSTVIHIARTRLKKQKKERKKYIYAIKLLFCPKQQLWLGIEKLPAQGPEFGKII